MSKRILILSYGTRGDVQPLIALGVGLQNAGYQVTLGADVEFETAVTNLGLPYAPLRLNLRQFLNSDAGKTAMDEEREVPEASFDTMIRPMLDDCWTAAQQGTDLLIYDTMLTPAYHIAEKLGIPAVMTSVMPNMTPTAAFSLIGAPKLGFGGWGNKLSYQLYRLSWRLSHKDVRKWTGETLGLTPTKWHNYWHLHGKRIPVLYSYSPAVLPDPADWPPESQATGYWFLPDSAAPYTPTPELEAFLQDTPQPIYIGFGSMVGQDAAELTKRVVSAVQKTQQRAVLVTGWGGLSDLTLPPEIFALSSVPHEWLFPRVSAVVHHGGAGTTAAGLRFGKPSVLCPFVTDQFFWGKIVEKRGWGPQAMPQKELTADKLAEGIVTAVENHAMRLACEEIATQIGQEDGVNTAVEEIKKIIN